MDYLYYLFGILLFVAVVLFIEGGYLIWNSSKGPDARRIARRLRIVSAGGHGGDQQISIVKERLLSESPALHQILQRMSRVAAIDRELQQSGLSWNLATLLGIIAAVFVVAFLACSFLAVPFLIKLAVAAAAATLPYLHVLKVKTKRLHRIEAQLPDALDLMGRAMRAGHAFPTALKMVGDEMTEPLAGEFGITFDQVNFGISMQDALVNLSTRVPSTDLRYFVIAVMIQRETGGNLAELLANISRIIRERMKLIGQVRVLSAEGKMSAWVLGLLPFGAAGMIQLTNPKFLEVLYTDPGGRKMLLAAAGMMVIGVIAMRKIIRIRV